MTSLDDGWGTILVFHSQMLFAAFQVFFVASGMSFVAVVVVVMVFVVAVVVLPAVVAEMSFVVLVVVVVVTVFVAAVEMVFVVVFQEIFVVVVVDFLATVSEFVESFEVKRSASSFSPALSFVLRLCESQEKKTFQTVSLCLAR